MRRQLPRELAQLTEQARLDGWQVELTQGERLRFKHPAVPIAVFAGPRPNDCRAIKNLRAQLRRQARAVALATTL